ncbi:MAG: hypothetical protein CVT49_05525 [candidate division Zixibacteria bacterium HGW-Zixibacteria-1]|nr:MAG: hypothetical protein CVT49_05525 [candidate division Zixibacteria bacterium HGW-Zixibacteria-1]
MDQQPNHTRKSDSGQIIGGIIVTGVGLLFLLVNLDIVPGLEEMWPVFIIIVGLALIVDSMRKRARKDNGREM